MGLAAQHARRVVRTEFLFATQATSRLREWI